MSGWLSSCGCRLPSYRQVTGGRHRGSGEGASAEVCRHEQVHQVRDGEGGARSDCFTVCRSDSFKALEVMAENFSVYRVISLVMAGFGGQKNVVIRANIANIVDSVIVR